MSLYETCLSLISATPIEFVLDMDSPEKETKTFFILKFVFICKLLMDSSTALAVSEIFIIDPFLRPEVETLEKSRISKLLVSLDAKAVSYTHLTLPTILRV